MKTNQPACDIDLSTGNGAIELEKQVQCKLGRQVRDFQLIFADKGLILRGRTRTYYAKQLAQHAVLEATEHPILANEIEVS